MQSVSDVFVYLCSLRGSISSSLKIGIAKMCLGFEPVAAVVLYCFLFHTEDVFFAVANHLINVLRLYIKIVMIGKLPTVRFEQP